MLGQYTLTRRVVLWDMFKRKILKPFRVLMKVESDHRLLRLLIANVIITLIGSPGYRFDGVVRD